MISVKILKKYGYIVYIIGLILISALLSGCDLINSVPNTMTITLPNGGEFEVEDEEIQNSYIDIFDNKQRIKRKPEYLSIENKYIVDYAIDGQQGSFEFYIQPSLVEVMVDLYSTEDIAHIVNNILNVTGIELEEIVFKDSFGFILEVRDAYEGNGSYKELSFRYSTNGFRVMGSANPDPAGIAFSTTFEKIENCKKTLSRLEDSFVGVRQVTYQGYDYPRTPDAILEHLYKTFAVDDNGNWYRISDRDIQFLIAQDEIYRSLRTLAPKGKGFAYYQIDIAGEEIEAEIGEAHE